MNKTIISWTDYTSNPIYVTRKDTGKRGWHCTRLGPECEFCYSAIMNIARLGTGLDFIAENDNRVDWHLNLKEMEALRTFRRPARVFVCDMIDIGHKDVPDDYIRAVFQTAADNPNISLQVLTKRTRRFVDWPGPWPENLWMGTSVGIRKSLYRVDLLRQCPAKVKFLSCEPLLESLAGIDLTGIDQVIAGGESGRHMNRHPERQMDHQWARELRDACLDSGTAFFFKQSSGYRTEMGTALEHEDGTLWHWKQYPGNLTAPLPM